MGWFKKAEKTIVISVTEVIEREILKLNVIRQEISEREAMVLRLNSDFLAILGVKMSANPMEISPFFSESLTLNSKMKELLIVELRREIEELFDSKRKIEQKITGGA